MIALRDTLDFQQLEVSIDPEGRFIILVCSINKQIFTLINVYAPNVHQIRFLRKVFRTAKPLKQGRLIVGGDFNLVPDLSLDSTSAAKRRRSPLQHLIATCDLYDVWRCHHGSEKDYTYYSPRFHSYSRIDLILTDKWVLQTVTASVIHAATWSDHSPISISIEDSNGKHNSYLWRVNNFILQHKDYSSDIANHIKEFFVVNTDSVADPAVVWRAHNAFMRGILMKLSAVHKRKRTQRIDDITTKIQALDSLHKSSPHLPIPDQLFSLRQELRSLLLHSHDYMHHKLQATTYFSSNKAGKRLAQRLKGRRVKSKIHKLFHPHTQTLLTNPQDIADAFSDYYSDLYNLNKERLTPQPRTTLTTFSANYTFPLLPETNC